MLDGIQTKDLDPGRCRFNCRTAKENFVAGYERAVRQFGLAYDDAAMRRLALDAWAEYRKERDRERR